MAHLVLLTGGSAHAHDFPATAAALVELLGDHVVDVVDDPDALTDRLDGADALVVHALHWRMLGPAYDAWRDRWAYTTPPTTRAAIAGFVAGGGGLVGCHTASICFDDWPEWREVLGGAWVWGRSSHPPLGTVQARVVAGADHPVVAGLPDEIEIRDEVYGDLDLDPRVEPLAHARRTPDDEPQPVVWVHGYGDGRVVYDGFGHDVASLRYADHVRLLRQAVLWVTARG